MRILKFIKKKLAGKKPAADVMNTQPVKPSRAVKPAAGGGAEARDGAAARSSF